MPSKITLTVIKGALSGHTYTFETRSSCVIGRGLDCNPRLPDDEFHRTISRNHCLLDVNPPDIRIRDFGSLNGTFVNGKKIGQRQMDKSAADARFSELPEYDLKDGDQISLGGTVMRVKVFPTPICAQCGVEIPEHMFEASEVSDGIFLCGKHLPSAEDVGTTKRLEAGVLDKLKPKCARCGKDATDEAGKDRHGKYVCTECRANPEKIVQELVAEANAGDEGLLNIKDYKIISELGKGGMGAVYLARHEKTNELVALKVMLPEVATEQFAKDMFLREVENTKSLNHPNIVALKDSGYSNGIFYFTLEFCDGGSVDQLMAKNGGKLDVDEAMPIILQSLDGLEYAHNAEVNVKMADGSMAKSSGIVHRDLKPANIFLAGKGSNRVAKIADVGLGKAFDLAGLSGQTRTGAVVGTPFFISRQQVINFKYAKPDIDVWGMAASLYNMITGKLPRSFLPGKDPWQVVLQSKPVPIRERDKSIPENLAKVIDHALIDQPEIPYKTAKQLKEALQKAL